LLLVILTLFSMIILVYLIVKNRLTDTQIFYLISTIFGVILGFIGGRGTTNGIHNP